MNPRLGRCGCFLPQLKSAYMFTRAAPGTECKQMAKHLKMKIDILWQGNPISCVKTFSTPSCQLCMKERIFILHHSHKDPESLINKHNKIYGTCRHNPKFHWFDTTNNTSTDESKKDERVKRHPLKTCASSLNAGISSHAPAKKRYQMREQT